MTQPATPEPARCSAKLDIGPAVVQCEKPQGHGWYHNSVAHQWSDQEYGAILEPESALSDDAVCADGCVDVDECLIAEPDDAAPPSEAGDPWGGPATAPRTVEQIAGAYAEALIPSTGDSSDAIRALLPGPSGAEMAELNILLLDLTDAAENSEKHQQGMALKKLMDQRLALTAALAARDAVPLTTGDSGDRDEELRRLEEQVRSNAVQSLMDEVLRLRAERDEARAALAARDAEVRHLAEALTRVARATGVLPEDAGIPLGGVAKVVTDVCVQVDTLREKVSRYRDDSMANEPLNPGDAAFLTSWAAAAGEADNDDNRLRRLVARLLREREALRTEVVANYADAVTEWRRQIVEEIRGLPTESFGRKAFTDLHAVDQPLSTESDALMQFARDNIADLVAEVAW